MIEHAGNLHVDHHVHHETHESHDHHGAGKPSVRDQAFKKWDLIIRSVALCVALPGLMLAYLDYRKKEQREFEQRKLELEKREEENVRLAEQHAQNFRFRLFEHKMQVYVDATEVAGRLAGATDAGATAADRQKFWALYWGPLSIFENEAVEKQLLGFGKALDAWRAGPPPPELKHACWELADACRTELNAYEVFRSFQRKGAQPAAGEAHAPPATQAP
ncbi:MAG: hypothetical protein KIS92_26420 [Planctomycetota bacterium]|nr:hypothetical protein [Planctomycetota bacterium]